MPEVQIVIDVSGESPGAPAVSREFPFSKLAASPVVTLKLASVLGINSFQWEIIDQPPPLVSPIVLADPTTAEQTFTLTELFSGTFLFRCTVNGGETFGGNGLAFLTENKGLRQPSVFETREFDAVRGWMPSQYNFIAAMDVRSGTVRTLSGTSESVSDSFDNDTVRCTNAGTVTITVPSGLTPNVTVEYMQEGAGQVQVVGSGVTLRKPATFNPHTNEQWSSVVITVLDTDEALVRGDLAIA